MSLNGLSKIVADLPPEERRRVLLAALARQPGVSPRRLLSAVQDSDRVASTPTGNDG